MKKKFVLALGAFVLVVLTAVPAVSHTNPDDLHTAYDKFQDQGGYDALRLPENTVLSFRSSSFFGSVNNKTDRILEAFTEINDVNDVDVLSGLLMDSFSNGSRDWEYTSTCASGDEMRDDYGGRGVVVMDVNLWSGGTGAEFSAFDAVNAESRPAAVTFSCDFEGDNKVDYFWIILNGEDFEWDWTEAGASNGELSGEGVLVHEFAHAYGFDGHWGAGPEAPAGCKGDPAPADAMTMCSGNVLLDTNVSAYTNNMRTLEHEDEQEFTEEY